MNTYLLIDGQNFLNYIRENLLREGKITKEEIGNIDWRNFDFKGLFDEVFKDFSINRKLFYLSKIVKYNETLEKSEKLIKRNRELKTYLIQQGFEVIVAGKVRGYFDEERKPHFHEKGVDVRIGVDMITFSLIDKVADRIILASSDSDIQPAIKIISKRGGTELVYLGFEISSNKGLAYTMNRKRLIRGQEVVRAYKK